MKRAKGSITEAGAAPMPRLNLVPEGARLRQTLRGRARSWIFTVAILGAALFGGWHYANTEEHAIQDARALLREERAGIRREQQRSSEIIARAERLRVQEQELLRLRRSRSWSARLAEVAQAVPDQALLRRIELVTLVEAQQPNVPQLPAAPGSAVPPRAGPGAPPPVLQTLELRLEGFAADHEVLAGFLRRLEAGAGGDPMRLVRSNAETLGKLNGFDFGIACRSRP